MKTKVLLFLCFFLGLAIVQLSAQKSNKKITITGSVIDADGSPVVNAMILVDGQKTNSVTDAKGTFRIKADPGALRIGIITFGKGMIEEDIAGRTVIDISFESKTARKPDPASPPSEEKVASAEDRTTVDMGYSKVKKKNLTQTVSKVDGTNSKRSYTSIYQMLQGISGVEVRGTSVNIHDSKNMTGYVAPLFVVDGVPVSDISSISPSTVESIEVLKGTAAAMYGSRGFGGVILIKLKKE
jgi:TonB-dependent SusC/RagA subfamily outer membrane receptor